MKPLNELKKSLERANDNYKKINKTRDKHQRSRASYPRANCNGELPSEVVGHFPPQKAVHATTTLQTACHAVMKRKRLFFLKKGFFPSVSCVGVL